MPSSLYSRHLRTRIAEALADTPVVLLNGPRQAGKTTLARQFASGARRYLTLDEMPPPCFPRSKTPPAWCAASTVP